MDMFPRFTANHSTHSAFAHAVFGGQLRAAHNTKAVLGADKLHHLFCESGVTIAFANWMCAMGTLVCLVCCTGVPAKVGDVVVCRVAIGKVAAFHTLRARSDEGFQNEVGDLAINAHTELNTKMTILLEPLRLQTSPHGTKALTVASADDATPHAAVAADLVAGKAFDIAVFDRRVDLRHGDLLAEMTVFRETIRFQPVRLSLVLQTGGTSCQ